MRRQESKEVILLFLAKGKPFGGREMNRGEDQSKNWVWEIQSMKHLESMLREISSKSVVMKKWGRWRLWRPQARRLFGNRTVKGKMER